VTTSNDFRKLAVVASSALVASALVLVAMVGHVEAAFPGSNGKIAFESDRGGDFEIYAMNPGGSNPTNRTDSTA
jgi:hypothetical protein